MQKMGIAAIYCKPRSSIKNPEHKIYPYLLKGLDIKESNKVWATDITYVPIKRGFLYLGGSLRESAENYVKDLTMYRNL